MISMEEKYKKEVIPLMKSKFGYVNDLAVPKIQKVVVNVGIGKFNKETEKVEEVIKVISEITGQKPIKTKSRKAISGFKIRQGLEIGIKTTLRGRRMWHFLERLVNVALPRTRDFQGIEKKSVDAGGNLNLGIKENLIFPEVSPEKVKNIFGLQITVVTSAKSQEKGLALFQALGFPIKQD